MNEIAFRKITKIEELKPGMQLLNVNRSDLRSAINRGDGVNACTINVIGHMKEGVEVIIHEFHNSNGAHRSILTESLFNSLSLYAVVDTLIKPERQVRKLEKKVKKYEKILENHGIETVQISQRKRKEMEKKRNKIQLKEQFHDEIFGYKVRGHIYTDNKREVIIKIRSLNYHLIVTTSAKCHPEDKFNYESGKKLAYARAIAEFMEKRL